MPNYLIATGHGVALMSLAALDPQPASRGMMVTDRSFGLSGAVYDLAPYIELEYSMVEDATQYLTILTQFGLHAATTANVTVYIPNTLYAYARYNALAVRPQIGPDGQRNNYFLRDFRILLKNLVAL